MIVIENNVFDDVEENLFLQENDEDHEAYKLMHDEEKFGKVQLMMIDLLN
jgi:hypothetical protein